MKCVKHYFPDVKIEIDKMEGIINLTIEIKTLKAVIYKLILHRKFVSYK